MIYKASVDYDFIDFYKLEIIEGRKFSRDMATDMTAYILNETAVRDFNLEKQSDYVTKFIINENLMNNLEIKDVLS